LVLGTVIARLPTSYSAGGEEPRGAVVNAWVLLVEILR